MNKVVIVENKSELGAGTRGSSLGPGALKIAAINNSNPLFHDTPIVAIPNENHRLFDEIHLAFAKRIGGIVDIYERLNETIPKLYADGSFPVILSGDHSSAGGSISGIRSAFPEKRLGVIWIDAHADLHSPFTTPSGNVHGMPLAAALGMDNLESKVNDPDEEAARSWDAMKKVGGVSPKILPEDIFFIAVRSTEQPENDLIARYDIPNYPVEHIRKAGTDNAIEQAKRHLSNCDIVYISFDVDSLDPTISRGTGTPVEGGLQVDEAAALLKGLLNWEKVVALEFTEINPILDSQNKMAEAAFTLLDLSVQTIKSRVYAHSS